MGEKKTVLQGRKKGSEIGDLILDATLNENHSHTATTVDSPIETGSKAEDHTRQEPDTLSLEGIWTDTPNDLERAELNRAKEQYDKLVRAKERGERVKVITGLRVYDNMVIQSVEATRDPGTGFSVPVSVTFKESRRVDQEIETITPPTETASGEIKHSARAPTQRGKQKGKPPSEETKESAEKTSSQLYQLFN